MIAFTASRGWGEAWLRHLIFISSPIGFSLRSSSDIFSDISSSSEYWFLFSVFQWPSSLFRYTSLHFSLSGFHFSFSLHSQPAFEAQGQLQRPFMHRVQLHEEQFGHWQPPGRREATVYRYFSVAELSLLSLSESFSHGNNSLHEILHQHRYQVLW